MPDKIGDPLADMAETGTLGKKKVQPEATSGDGAPASPIRQVKKEGEKDQQVRVKRTLMFTRTRARWLKVQAALEGREMSDIVDEALETYQQLHPQK